MGHTFTLTPTDRARIEMYRTPKRLFEVAPSGEVAHIGGAGAYTPPSLTQNANGDTVCPVCHGDWHACDC